MPGLILGTKVTNEDMTIKALALMQLIAYQQETREINKWVLKLKQT